MILVLESIFQKSSCRLTLISTFVRDCLARQFACHLQEHGGQALEMKDFVDADASSECHGDRGCSCYRDG